METGHPIVAGLLKGKVLALGRTADIERAFAPIVDSKIQQVSLAESELSIRNGVVRQLMLRAITDALSARKVVKVGRHTLRAPTGKFHDYKGRRYEYFDSIALSLDVVDGTTYLITLPDVHLNDPADKPLGTETIKAVKRDILWRQRNREYIEAVKNWRRLLFAPGWRVVFPPGAETGFEFHVDKAGPVCARRYSAQPKPADPKLVESFAPLERFRAFEIPEPVLRFRGDGKGGNRNSIHPIKGLVDCGGPVEWYDKLLHGSKEIRVGVVCAEGHESLLSEFLSQLNKPAQVGRYDDPDYLVDFPGFQAAFGCGLLIPKRGDAAWGAVGRILGGDAVTMSRRATDLITEQIRRVEAVGVDVIVVYIPTAWSSFERVITDTVYLDLHDQIKAFAVHKHVRTQLIREMKVRNERSPRIRWWLSLALFTKALRVPWMLESDGEKVAYAGIGYAVDETKKDGRIVLGCSHVFNAAGVGMRFRLVDFPTNGGRSGFN